MSDDSHTEQGASDGQHETAPTQGQQVVTPYLTSWCGGTGCDNCKLCLIFSGKAELIRADEGMHVLTYRIIE